MPPCDVHAAISGAEGLNKSATITNMAVTGKTIADAIIRINLSPRLREIMDESCANFWRASAPPSLLLSSPIHFNSKPSRHSNSRTCW